MDFLKTAYAYKADYPNHSISYLGFEIDNQKNDFSEIKIVNKTKNIFLSELRVSSVLNIQEIEYLNLMYGIGIEEQTIAALRDQNIQEKNKQLYEKYKELAEIKYNKSLYGWKKTLRRIFPKIDLSSHIKNNKETSDIIVKKIISESNRICALTRIGKGDFIICNQMVASLIQDHPAFIFSNSNRVEPANPIINYIGQLNGIAIFVNLLKKPDDCEIIVGKTTDMGKSGVILAEMYPTIEKEEIVDPLSTSNKKRISLVQKMSITETDEAYRNFSILKFSGKKKPFWKYLLFI